MRGWRTRCGPSAQAITTYAGTPLGARFKERYQFVLRYLQTRQLFIFVSASVDSLGPVGAARTAVEIARNRGLYSTCWPTHKLHLLYYTPQLLDARLGNVSGLSQSEHCLTGRHRTSVLLRLTELHPKSFPEQRLDESVPQAPLWLLSD